VDLLLRAEWAGNVRELRATMARALDAMDGDEIVRPEHLDSPSIRAVRETWKSHSVPFTDVVSQEEIRRIHEALTRSAGVVSRAAEFLGLNPSALARRIKKYRLQHLALQPRGRPAGDKSGGIEATGSDDANGHRLSPQSGRAKRTTPSA
jgi:DNA-binding NtrC family response regulator